MPRTSRPADRGRARPRARRRAARPTAPASATGIGSRCVVRRRASASPARSARGAESARARRSRATRAPRGAVEPAAHGEVGARAVREPVEVQLGARGPRVRLVRVDLVPVEADRSPRAGDREPQVAPRDRAESAHRRPRSRPRPRGCRRSRFAVRSGAAVERARRRDAERRRRPGRPRSCSVASSPGSTHAQIAGLRRPLARDHPLLASPRAARRLGGDSRAAGDLVRDRRGTARACRGRAGRGMRHPDRTARAAVVPISRQPPGVSRGYAPVNSAGEAHRARAARACAALGSRGTSKGQSGLTR